MTDEGRRLPPKKRGTRGSPSGRLRIVAGKWRSRLLPVADVQGLRPTPERVRETLFNWLAPVIEGARCLDLYAGTGALGYEALSRGAASTDFVESSSDAVRQLRDNARLLQATGALIHRADAVDFLQKRDRDRSFDVVFLDPPFADARYRELCRLLDERGWLAPGAYVYIEMDRRLSVPDLPDGWNVQKERTAGNVRYALIRTNHEECDR